VIADVAGLFSLTFGEGCGHRALIIPRAPIKPHACTSVTGAILWANLHLLFWLSLFPFAAGWMGENHFTAVPTALYGIVLLMAAIAYHLLQQGIIRAQGGGRDRA
jgi:uncharacterized membrane protein